MENYGVDESSSDNESLNWDAPQPEINVHGEAWWEVSRDATRWRKDRLRYAEKIIEEDYITGVYWLFHKAEQDCFREETILFIKYLFL